ncbi:divalent-cation tolerance protein CutA [Candidatus Woesearchaeota archaeon]|nr:divalent-cation tolerance protein CutA [Candidatus Woesearchaeota archaeon]
MIALYVPCSDEKEAAAIGKALLEKKLAVCINTFPITSMYLWKGDIEGSKEAVLIAKTFAKKHKDAELEIKKHHSYEVPCIIRIPVEINEDYRRYAEQELL